MTEQEFAAWLADRAPRDVPASLSERVLGIPQHARPDDEPLRWLTWVAGPRRLLAVALLALALGAAVLQTASRPEPPPVAHGTGVIVLGRPMGALVIDPSTGDLIREGDPRAPGRLFTDSGLLIGSGPLAWSPDGATIAGMTQRGLRMVNPVEGEESYSVHIKGCGVRTGCELDWSPDGRSMAVARGHDLVVYDLASGQGQTIFNEGRPVGGVAWSHDGQWIAFPAETDLLVIRPDGTGLRRLRSTPGSLGPIDPAWSLDDRQVAFLTSAPWDEQTGWSLRIASIDLESEETHELTPAGACFCVGWGPPGWAWSPDRTAIAFVTLNFDPERERTLPRGDAGGQLWITDVDGSNPRFVVGGVMGTPEWQPVPNLGR